MDTRSSSIDFFRTIAIFAIITLHTSPFHGRDGNLLHALDIGINQATRFAIPYFLIVSGYYFRKKVSSDIAIGNAFKIYLQRIIPLFLIWTCIYIIVPTDIKKQVMEYGLLVAMSEKSHWIIADPATLLFQGYKGHLWYLISLLWALSIVTILSSMKKERWLLPIALTLCMIGLLGGSYAATPLGINLSSFDTRNGPFFSTIFVSVGWYWAGNNFHLKRSTAIILLVVGIMMHVCEASILWKIYEVNPMRHDFLVGTIVCGVAFTAYVLTLQNTAFDNNLLARWGKYTLGVYLIHMLIIDVMTPLDRIVPFPVWDISYPFLVYLISVGTVMAFSRWKWTRKLVAY